MAKKILKIPFERSTGNPCHYLAPHGANDPAFEYRDNFEFRDTLKFKAFEKGRHTSHAIFEGTSGIRYVMFLGELENALVAGAFAGDSITGLFTFTGRGGFYGVRLV